ncbi:MAG TPA: M4 family metallopeptidase [Thermodesulfobacteriota bacterium]|nr:M4 family metallopeptidase [Thermodesulfobacteriota bacterium]
MRPVRYIEIHSIIPPYMLEEIAKRGKAHQKDWALQNLTSAGFIRGQRFALGILSSAAPVGHKYRTVYDCKHKDGQPPTGTLVRQEGDPAKKDVAVNEAYDGAGATYDLYYDIYERNSIDNRGMSIVSYVHYDVNYDNAFWDGSEMVYGDGDGEIFARFTKCIDVIGHELTHGVTQYEANLAYSNQPGALNESMSDVFGSLVKQRTLKQTAAKADWLIGAGLLMSKIHGKALRSMKAPGTAYDDPVLGKDPQPATMRDYVQTTSDNGGVHINSGIPNHAFYLAAIEIGGNAWTKAGKIWYIALRDRLRSKSNFAGAASATISVAKDLYGNGSKEMKAVQKAWKAVGVT